MNQNAKDAPAPVDVDDVLIWGLHRGDALTAYKDLILEDDGVRAFTKGLTYQVESMHPIAAPACVTVSNDQSQPHRLSGSDVREYFRP